MSYSYLLLTPLLTFFVVLLAGFVGCHLLFGLEELPDYNAPTNLTGTAKHNQIDLSWQKPAKGTAPTGYRIYRHGMGETYQAIHDNDATTAYSDMGVMDGMTYTYKVANLRGGSEEEVSNEFEITAGLMGLRELIDLAKVTLGPMPQNGFGGLVGMQITIGSAPIVAKTLGRYKLPGNTGSHNIKIIDSMTKNDMSGGGVTVNLSDPMYSPGQFAYAALATEVTLNPNTSYFVLCMEMTGGDFYQDSSDTKLTELPQGLTAVTAANFDGTNYNVSPTSLSVYGPLSLQY